MSLDELLDAAAALVGTCSLVTDLTFSGRATVARLRLDDGSTVIAKRPRSTAAHDRELAALRTLPPSVRPALVAAGGGLLVMEDLGTGPSLADLLLGSDPTAAEAAVLAWAATLGTALRPTLRDGVEEEPERLVEGLDQLRLVARELGVAVPAEVEGDLDHVAAALARPGPWLAFCTGDTCPDNNRVLPDGTLRFFDFEIAGWRHAATEAAYCRAPFCTCWCVARLPDGTTERMEEAFLDALSPPDPDRFTAVVGLAQVYFTVRSFDWFRRFVLENRPPGPPDRAPCTGRQYVYQRLRNMTAERDQIPALAAIAADLADRIAQRWPEATALPLYPAFG